MTPTESQINPAVQNLLLEGKANLVWEMLCKVLEGSIGESEVERWFRPLSLGGVQGQTLLLSTKDEVFQVWIEMNHMTHFLEAMQKVFGQVLEVEYTIVEEGALAAVPAPIDNVTQDVATDEVEVEAASPVVEKIAQPEPVKVKKVATSVKRKRPNLSSDFTFENFVVGPNSQFAHAAASAVAETEDCAYNPLFIHGKPGNGKTHLCQAIAHEVLDEQKDRKVLYVTCETFTNDYIEALQKNDLKKFRSKYRRADLLIVEDVQFLASKEKTQEEFFHTFNELMNSSCQVVFTSDRPVCEIKQVDSRLSSRFESGLAVELEAPEIETRMAILRRKVQQVKSTIGEEVIKFIAENISSNVRKLLGALTTITTYTDLAKFTKIDMKQVEFLLRNQLADEGGKEVSIEGIQKAVAAHYELKVSDLTGARRLKKVAYARQVAMFLSRELTKSSLAEIGQFFGGRDHGTVLHAHKKINKEISADRNVQAVVERLQVKLA